MAGDDRSGKTEFDCPDDCPDSIVVINLPPDVTYADIRSYFLRNDVEMYVCSLALARTPTDLL